MKIFNTKILGTGGFLPDKILTNDEIAKRVDTNNQWIVERTGISERRVADPSKGELPSEMAKFAALKAIEAANLTPNDIDLILFSVTAPDALMPNTASVLQHKLGITSNCGCLDINAACSGWIYGLTMADALIKTGANKHILLIGCEMTTGFTDFDDRNTCILFGDGCGAVVLGRASENEDAKVYSSVLSADSSRKDHLTLGIGVGKIAGGEESKWIRMNGQEVFKAAAKTMAALSEKVIQDAEMKTDQVDWFIPHQANLRIIEAVGSRFNFPPEKVVVNVNKYANTSSASIPIALDEIVREGKLKRGDNLLLAAFGAGLTAGAVLLKY